MTKRQKKKTKPAQKSGAVDKSSAAGKRTEQGSKAAQTAPSKAPIKGQSAPMKRTTPAANKGAGQNSKSTSLAKERTQSSEPKDVVKNAGQRSEPKPKTAPPVERKPPKRKNVSQNIPNGRTLQTRDEYIGEGNKKYRKPGYGKKGNYRKVVVVDSNRNDEVAVVKLTTSESATPIEGYKNGKSRYKPFVETKDSDGKPIKIGKKFTENPPSADMPRGEVTEIKKQSFKEDRNAKKNRKAVRKMKGRKKNTEN